MSFPVPEDYEQAGRLQRELAMQVVVKGDPGDVRLLAALDASHKRGGDLVAAAVLWDCRQSRVREVGLNETLAFVRIIPTPSLFDLD